MYRVADPERYFKLFKDVIEEKQKIIALLDAIKKLEGSNESTAKETTQLMLAVGRMRKAIEENPYQVHTFTGEIEKKL